MDIRKFVSHRAMRFRILCASGLYIVFGKVLFIFNHDIHVPSHTFLRRGLEVKCRRGRTISNFASIDFQQKDIFHFMKKLLSSAGDC